MRVKNLMVLIFYVILACGALSCAPQKVISSADDSPTRSLVLSQDFRFKAEFANPQGGRQIPLTGSYELQISKESVRSYLPYFGVAHQAPIGADEGGIMFTSKDFQYNAEERKNGWNIRIRPNDTRDVRTMYLRITRSGSASLQVTSNYKQAISYSGQIVQPRSR